MTGVLWANRVLLTLLSISTGAVKLAQMEAEMVIFRAVGLADGLTISFGVWQLIGGVLLVPNKTTRIGAWVMLPTFVLATGVVLANRMWVFGAASVLFIVMAGVHAAYWPRSRVQSARALEA